MKQLFALGTARGGTTFFTRMMGLNQQVEMASDPFLPVYRQFRNHAMKNISELEFDVSQPLSDHYFDDISNNKVQPYNLTTTRYDNGQVWTLCWFIWTGSGKYTGTEAQILVHYGFRWKGDKIVAAYHFFDPTLINNEIAAAE